MKKRLRLKRLKMQSLLEHKGRETESRQPAGEVGVERYIDQIQRLKADFDNYRKRVDKDRAQGADRARMGLLKDFLDLCDTLRQATENKPQVDNEHLEAYREGLVLILKKFEDFLQKEGVQPIETEGQPFDPRFHEAVMTEEGEPEKSWKVARELQKGYTYKDEVLRPSRVSVYR